MEITWDEGRIWHSDCTTRGSGIMVPLVKEQDRTLFKCLMCDKQGYYPHGGRGTWCTEEVHNASFSGAGTASAASDS